MRSNMLAGVVVCGSMAVWLTPATAAPLVTQVPEHSRRATPPVDEQPVPWENLSGQFTVPLGPHFLEARPRGFLGGPIPGPGARPEQQ